MLSAAVLSACGGDGEASVSIPATATPPAASPSPTATRQPVPPTIVSQVATAEDLNRNLDDAVFRAYDGLSRITGAFNLDNCGSPCEIDFDYGRNVEGTKAFCLRSVDAPTFRMEPNYDASQHEVRLSALEQACYLVSQMGRDAEKDRALAQSAFEIIEPLVPVEMRH
jgi:hypothetical protein